MSQMDLQPDTVSTTKVIAASGSFQIELIEKAGVKDYPILINISQSLSEEYGPKAVLTVNTIQTYFNREGSMPFIARHQGDIIGYIIGVPIESLSQEPWARIDENFGKNNTLYTYAFVIQSQYQGSGYAKMLKRVYLNWAKKRKDIQYITGHVKSGISSRFTGEIRIVDRIENWQGTGKEFEYYRRDLDPDRTYAAQTDPPLSNRF